MKFGQTRRSYLCRSAGLAALFASALAANAAVYRVNVDPSTLYTDPCNGNQIKLGGFSGLYPVPGEPGRLFVVSDKGPGPDFGDFKILPLPWFGPNIMTLAWNAVDQRFEIVNVMPLTRLDSAGHLVTVTGLPNDPPPDSGENWDLDLNVVPHDNDSIDSEGITMDPWGHFWVCEEYMPSVAMADASGQVLLRLIPEGTLKGDELIPTYDVLPGVLAKRRTNRGLEGIAVARNGRLYSIMQRPLVNPTSKVGDASQNLRIVEVDLGALIKGKNKPLVRQLIYRTEPNANQSGVYASDLFSVTPSIFLVPERVTDKLYAINVSPATDITPLESADGKIKPEYLAMLPNPAKNTIEQLDEAGLAALGIKTVKKTVVLDSLTALDPGLAKCEGVCLVGKTIVLTFDNDFNLDVATLHSEVTSPMLEINLQDPPNLPKIITVPWPAALAFGKE